MKIEKPTILRWFAIAIILFFALEFFVPLLYVQPQATPTPTPQPKEYLGNAASTATITELTPSLIASCKASVNASDFDLMKTLAGVKSVLKISAQLALIEANTSVEETNAIQQAWQNACADTPQFLRRAFVKLEDKVIFKNTANEEKTIYSTYLQQAFQTGGFRQPMAIVQASAQVNQTIPVTISIKLSGEAIVELPGIIEVIPPVIITATPTPEAIASTSPSPENPFKTIEIIATATPEPTPENNSSNNATNSS